MASIGIPELLVIALIGVVLFAGPVAVFVWLLRQRRVGPPGIVSGLVQCRACGTALPPGAPACAQCGTTREV